MNCSEELNLCHGYDPYVMFDSENKYDGLWLCFPYFLLACLVFFIAKTLHKTVFSRVHYVDEDEEDVVEDEYEEAIEMASVWNWNEGKLRCDVIVILLKKALILKTIAIYRTD